MALSTHQVHVVAGTACVAPATVRRYLARGPMRVTTEAAIASAIRKVLKLDPEAQRAGTAAPSGAPAAP